MPEAEKQESQKTVVAFIAGLLIGGLLVWVFSSSPADAPAEENNEGTDAAETATPTGDDTPGPVSSTDTLSAGTPTAGAAEGVIIVADQPAGDVVVLDSTAFPAAEGWVAVREGSRVLGASRYNLADGLIPTEIRLLRNTSKGNSYRAVYYTDNGDRVFDLEEDFEVEGVSDVFVAQ